MKTPQGHAWAKDVYAQARARYHPVTQESVDKLMAAQAR